MYYDHSTCMYYDDRTCMYYGHSTYMYYDHSTCMDDGHSTCMYYDHSTCMYMIIVACTMIKVCMYYDHSICISIIVEHVSCPTWLMLREIEDGGLGGEAPWEKQGCLGPLGPPMLKLLYLIAVGNN